MPPRRSSLTPTRPAERRRPTYGAALRLARLALELRDRPQGWSYEAACEELRISERTLLRYLSVCRAELVDRHERPLIETFTRAERRHLRLTSSSSGTDGNAYEAASLFFNMALARFLQGTVLDQGSEGVFERVRKSVSPKLRPLLDNLDRKLFALPHASKDYRAKDDELGTILRALLHETRLSIDYAGLVGEGKKHAFDPYTLLGYRGGLYLLGHSHLYRKVIWLAVDRIRAVEVAKESDGRPVRFVYPKTFHPERHTNGMFGIVEGPETEVELAIENAATEAYLRERRIHPSQSFVKAEDGRMRVLLRVRGTAELANWVLGLMPYVEVVRPAELRAEIRSRMTKALGLHQSARRGPAEARVAALEAVPRRGRVRKRTSAQTRQRS